VTRTARGDDMFIQMLGSAADHMIEHGAMRD
jgi:predicted small integral membrane protein